MENYKIWIIASTPCFLTQIKLAQKNTETRTKANKKNLPDQSDRGWWWPWNSTFLKVKFLNYFQRSRKKKRKSKTLISIPLFLYVCCSADAAICKKKGAIIHFHGCCVASPSSLLFPCVEMAAAARSSQSAGMGPRYSRGPTTFQAHLFRDQYSWGPYQKYSLGQLNYIRIIYHNSTLKLHNDISILYFYQKL